jgi:hypothetical protein
VADSKSYKAGSTIPLKWTLSNALGTLAGNVSSFKSLDLTTVPGCVDSGGGEDLDLLSPGSSGLTYSNGMFQFNWQTKGLAAGCYKVTVSLDDGSGQSTVVQLKSNGK